MMKRRHIIGVGFAACCVVWCVGDIIADPVARFDGTADYTIEVPSFASSQYPASDDAVNKCVGGYTDCCQNIVNQLSRKGMPDEQFTYAAYVAGQLRVVGAVTPLVERIETVAPHNDMRGRIPRWGRYPAVDALRRIGWPAVIKVLEILPNETNDTRRKCLCDVLRDVVGSTVARTIIAEKASAETDTGRSARWQLAIQVLDSAK